MKKLFVCLAVSVMFIGSGSAKAGQNFIQLSLFNPVQLLDEGASVTGIRLNLIYTVNQDVTGVDWGLVNKTNGNFLGVSDGAVNIVEGKMTGLQMGFVNVSNEVQGVQFGFVNKTDSLNGIQIGLVNLNDAGPFKILPIVNFSFN